MYIIMLHDSNIIIILYYITSTLGFVVHLQMSAIPRQPELIEWHLLIRLDELGSPLSKRGTRQV